MRVTETDLNIMLIEIEVKIFYAEDNLVEKLTYKM